VDVLDWQHRTPLDADLIGGSSNATSFGPHVITIIPDDQAYEPVETLPQKDHTPPDAAQPGFPATSSYAPHVITITSASTQVAAPDPILQGHGKQPLPQEVSQVAGSEGAFAPSHISQGPLGDGTATATVMFDSGDQQTGDQETVDHNASAADMCTPLVQQSGDQEATGTFIQYSISPMALDPTTQEGQGNLGGDENV
jgi:hypothetical protein